ncbi:response regulator [Patescibacteria group bacterium]|nr:response regulator [Patescibacteria group bacterium]
MKKILIVENDDAGRFVLTRRLKMEGYDVIEAESAEDVINKAKKENPDLIVLRADIPERKGMMRGTGMNEEYKVAEKLKKEGIAIPIIFTTICENDEQTKGICDKEIRNKYHELGVVDLFVKPFNPNAILERIRQILN